MRALLIGLVMLGACASSETTAAPGSTRATPRECKTFNLCVLDGQQGISAHHYSCFITLCKRS